MELRKCLQARDLHNFYEHLDWQLGDHLRNRDDEPPHDLMREAIIYFRESPELLRLDEKKIATIREYFKVYLENYIIREKVKKTFFDRV